MVEFNVPVNAGHGAGRGSPSALAAALKPALEHIFLNATECRPHIVRTVVKASGCTRMPQQLLRFEDVSCVRNNAKMYCNL